MLTPEEILERLRTNIDNQENIERKRRARFQLDVMLGAIEPYVRQQLRRFYVQDDDFIVLSFANICKKAVENLARLYSKEPKRRFINCTETQAEYLEQLYQMMKVNQMMLKVNQIYKLSNQIHFQVMPTLSVSGAKTLGMRLLPSDHVDVVESLVDQEKAEAYAIGASEVRVFRIQSSGETEVQSTSGKERLVSVWSKDYNFIADVRGFILSDDLENPLNMVPIIEVAGSKYGDYFKTATESFADFTIQFNASISDAGQAKRFQGLPIGWVKGDPEQLKNEFTFGPNKLYKLPRTHDGRDAEIGFTNPNVNLDALVNFDSSLLSLFLTCADIDPNEVSFKNASKTFTSGFERMLSMIEAFQPSEKDETLFKETETRLVRLVGRYLNVYGGVEGWELDNVGTIPDDVDVAIEYFKPEHIMSKAETLDVIERELSLGLISQVEAVMKYRDMTFEEAQKFLAENQRA